MPAVTAEVLADTLAVTATIDDIPIPITRLGYQAKANTARTVSFTVTSFEHALLCKLGSKVEVQVGRDGVVSNLSFIGIIKRVQPTDEGASVTAMDYITLLATSTFVDYKIGDIIGRDLYFLASSAMNIDEIDTTFLTQGSGIKATAEMKLEGLQTRKEFIDKCFRHMYTFVEDATSYFDKLNIVYYQYAIHMSNRMDIMRVDPENIHSRPTLSISTTSNTVTDLEADYNTTLLVNSATVVSSTNDKIFFTYNDADSIAKYGVSSKLFTLQTENLPMIMDEAQRYVNRYKEPIISYSIQLRNAEHLVVGDLVEVTAPLLSTKHILPISGYSIDTNNGLISSLTLGGKEASLSELIKKATE